MSSHYREHVSYPNVTAGPYPPQLAAALDNVASNVQDDSNPRHCSVKGCSVPLSPDYPHKMCEECRGRHRVYAMTKRAKRKMEKALLNGSAQNGQPVAWMPPDDAAEAEEEHPGQQPPEPVVGPSRQFESPPQEPMEESNQPEYDFSQQWDANSIDPRLFSQIQSHTSELAGALTLPPPPHHPANHETYSRNSHPPQQQSRAHSAASPPAPPPPPPAPEIHPILAEVLKSVPGVNLTTRFTSGPTVFPGPADGPLPPRFCSIKGCKTLIAGNSFFKMCEPCRDRYRNYGTTKRAKWKREKEVAVAELHQLRDKEDVRRASEGLPPLPPPDGEHWQEYQPGEGEPTDSSSGARPSGSPGPTDTGEECSSSSTGLPPRMCTVSHCREILPGGYEFLRCERHRIQNRHHSKLKRVRDKEVKAQVYDGWAAAIAPRADGERPADGGDPTPAAAMDPDAAAAQEIAFTFSELADPARDGMESEYITEAAAVDFIHETGTGISPTLALHMTDQEDTPLGEPMTGVPPAARGTRRTNHVCSIKACSNLLSPSNPWKMCDLCRSRDRAGRRIKALRDSGLIPPEEAAAKIVEVRMEVEGKERRERKDKGTKKKNKGKKKKKRDAEEGAREGLDESSGLGHGEGSSGGAADEGVVAAQGGGDPQTSVFSSVPVPNHANLVFMQPVFGQLPPHFQQYYAQAAGSSVPSTTSRSSESGGLGAGDGSAPPLTNGADTGNAPPATPKKRGKGKGKAKATEQESASQPTDASMSASQAPPAHYPPPNGHPYPYYMPPFMSPYGAPPGFPYGYPAPPPSPTKGGAYSPPAYQPPPYGACPYPYPYPGHPYPYPGQPYPPPPGQSYSPPPAGQAYTPPPPYPPPPSGEQSETHQPPYPHPMPPYPYAHPYPVPPPPPPHQPPTTEQPQQQPQQPSSSAPEDPPILGQSSASTKRSKSSKASTKGNSAKGNAAKDPPPHNFAEVEQPAQKGRTFIVRTSETYESPVTNGAKPFSLKRRRDEDGGGATSPNKRAEPEAWTYSQFRVSLNGTPVPTPSPPIPVTSVLNPSDFAHAAAPVPVVEENVVAAPTTAAIVENGVSVSEKQGQCGNKTCKRVLPSGTAGSLCERCRERLKKKQAKAKQRFKLEPKALLRRDLADAVTA